MGKALDLVGKKFGRLTVMYKNGHLGKAVAWHCKCDCGGKLYPNCTGEIDTTTHSLTHGLTTSCGCVRYEKWRAKQDEISAKAIENHKTDLLYRKFGNLTAIEGLDDDWWLCRCDCGNTTKRKRNTLLYADYVLKCEKCNATPDIELSDKRFGMWTVKSYAGSSKWNCICDCGNKGVVETNKLLSGLSTKCKNHSKSIDKLRSALVDVSPDVDLTSITSNSYVDFICPIHGVYRQQVKQHVRLMDGKIMRGCPKCSGNIGNNGSMPEDEIATFIKSKYDYYLDLHNTDILNGKELDIYIPDRQIGIEYNGSAFHASLNAIFDDKPKYYHRDKFLLAKSKGVHLISVFDIDYLSDSHRILSYLDEVLSSEVVHDIPHTDIVITNNDYDSGEWLRQYGYKPARQIDPESFIFKDQYLVYRSGKTEWIKD